MFKTFYAFNERVLISWLIFVARIIMAIRVNSILFVFFGIGTEYALLYLALGKSLGGLILSIGRQGLFFVPVILLLPHYIGLNGVIFAQPIADVFTLIAIIILATKINHEIKTLSLKA